MTHCRVSEELDSYLNAEEKQVHYADAVEEKEKEVRETFIDIAMAADGFEGACHWLGGVFSEELMDNALTVLFGDVNPYFQEAVTKKAAELVDKGE